MAAQALVVTNLHFRAASGPQAPSIGTIPAGSAIEVEHCGGGWCAAFWAGRRGYVSEDYIRFGALTGPLVYPGPPPLVYRRVYPAPYPAYVYPGPRIYYRYGPRWPYYW
jgi:hypothetical protein